MYHTNTTNCSQQIHQIVHNKYIKLFTTNATSLRINIQQYNIVVKQYATIVVHSNSTILPCDLFGAHHVCHWSE
jgi:hypothetical protein